MAENKDQTLPVPGSDAPPEKIFDYSFLHDKPTIDYLNKHGRVMFIIRGPPGTGKETLSEMISSKYLACKVLSAKDYFSQPLSESRGRNGGKLSHEWCYKRTVDACKMSTRVITARNTNVRMWEIKRYLHLSQDYGYTTIIADASKKFQFDAEILAQSNTQGLSSEYFKRRLCGWDEVVPWYTGWFLNPADSQWLRNKASRILSDLKELPQFKTDFKFGSDSDSDLYDKDEKELFCIAEFCSCQKSGEVHYLNKKVQNEIGKMSELIIQAFLFTCEMVLAVVSLSPEQYALSRIAKTKPLDSSDSVTEMFQKLGIQSRRNPKDIEANNCSITSQQTLISEDQCSEDLPLTCLSYIVIKHNSIKSFPYIKDIDNFSAEIFATIKEQTSLPLNDFEFSFNSYKTCQLKPTLWLICPSEKYIMQSVFTGLYS